MALIGPTALARSCQIASGVASSRVLAALDWLLPISLGCRMTAATKNGR
jgi:hypothetical protein